MDAVRKAQEGLRKDKIKEFEGGGIKKDEDNFQKQGKRRNVLLTRMGCFFRRHPTEQTF